tara:strand:- start:614 stop:841 length:228 start_codon:yes stop_codon:yes gene_type:complete
VFFGIFLGVCLLQIWVLAPLLTTLTGGFLMSYHRGSNDQLCSASSSLVESILYIISTALEGNLKGGEEYGSGMAV